MQTEAEPITPVNPWRLPASLWVWLAVLFATYALPRWLAVETPAAKSIKRAGITAAGLQSLQGAEYETHLALVPALAGQAGAKKAQGKQKSYAEAAADSYREIAMGNKGIQSARKVIVLEHLAKKPLDEAFLTAILARNLSASGASAGAVGAETALWRSIYGAKERRFDPVDADRLLPRVRAFHLGILESQVIADVYTAADRVADAKRVADALQRRASSEMLRLVLMGLLAVGAGLAGVIFLILFAIAASGRKWDTIARVPAPETPPVGTANPLSFGALLDCFVAYLAISRAVGLLAGTIPALAALPLVYLAACIYVGTGGLATLYLLHRARAERWSFPAFGLRTAGFSDVLYGVAGFCAALPISLLLATLNKAILHGIGATPAPNPVLPMIAGEGSGIGRFVLFCLVALAAPIFEELFFRGVLYSALKTRLRTPACVLISAACFAVVHPPGDWLPIFGLGCVLATAREMRQSLVPGIVIHFCQNAMTFAALSSLFAS